MHLWCGLIYFCYYFILKELLISGVDFCVYCHVQQVLENAKRYHNWQEQHYQSLYGGSKLPKLKRHDLLGQEKKTMSHKCIHYLF